ncbi:hypothetical protein UlMin_034624 [Ulmus minor]
MEKRKWLWKRRSSDKSPCETESSGSISSHSERYSDEQEALKGPPDDNTQSPEVSSKPVADTEHVDDSSLKKEDVADTVKSLTERLSAALVNVSAKDDLVKQHSKVAEEAVAGWEKAENEVATLKQQLEAAVKQNSALEDRVSHLDGALRECVRELRQARDEQEQKINEAVSKKTREWESTNSKLESQLLELQNKAEAIKTETPSRVDPDFCITLEYLENENSALKLELEAQAEELEVRTIERDLSTQAAETASKQHLESIKKVAKLEAECRRLKAMASKSSFNDHKSTAATSTYVESSTDSHSDSGDRQNAVEISTHKMNSMESNKSLSDSWASALIAELDQFKNEKTVQKNLPASSVEIDLMDDFLEMERLASLQPSESRSSCLEPAVVANQPKNVESVLRTELEAMIRHTAELEMTLEKLQTEKTELEVALTNSRYLRIEHEATIRHTAELEQKLKKLQAEKMELEAALTKSEDCVLRTEYEAMICTAELEEKLQKLQIEKSELETTLARSRDSVLRTEHEAIIHWAAELEEKLAKLEMEKTELETALTESQDRVSRTEHETMIHRTAELEEKLEKVLTEKTELETALAKTQDSVLKTEHEAVINRTTELEDKLEKLQMEKTELEKALTKSQDSVTKAEYEGMIHRTAELEEQLEKLETEKAELEEQLEKFETEKAELETALAKSQDCIKAYQHQLAESEAKLEDLQRELDAAKESKQRIESQLTSIEAETRTMSAKVNSLEEEVQRERALSAAIAVKCRDLEDELSREKQEVQLQQTASSNGEMKIKQEDLTMAAGKLAECQKTIASLGNQLKSLATLEDFLIDTGNIPGFSASASEVARTAEQWKLHSNVTFSPKRDSNSSNVGDESSAPPLNKREENPSPPSSSSSSSSTSAVVMSTHVSSEKNRNGFAKFFSRTKSGIRLEI